MKQIEEAKELLSGLSSVIPMHRRDELFLITAKLDEVSSLLAEVKSEEQIIILDQEISQGGDLDGSKEEKEG